MADTQRYLTEPVELPIEPWLYGYQLRQGCEVCVALDKQFKESEKRGDQRAMCAAAAEIRSHHGRRNHFTRPSGAPGETPQHAG
ncbi:hypothetical protein [Streptomyces sp. Da 82-17]|uniref:hypothetical protein n=1 Tax=Streptomyces sp. Da 82-17 TaxID=3377116 RepID=UPI0038D50ACA